MSGTSDPSGGTIAEIALRQVLSDADVMFSSVKHHETGRVSVADWAAMWNEGKDDAPNWLRISKVLDSDNDGHFSKDEFMKIYLYYQHFRAGYITGYQTRNKMAETNDINMPLLEFYQFLSILADENPEEHTRSLSASWTLSTSSWATVLRPGLLKTPILKRRKLTAVEDFLAGSYAGFITTLVGHPFDTIKVRMQTSSQVLTLPLSLSPNS